MSTPTPKRRPKKTRKPTKAEYSERAGLLSLKFSRIPPKSSPVEAHRIAQIEAVMERYRAWETWPALVRLGRMIRETRAATKALRRELGL